MQAVCSTSTAIQDQHFAVVLNGATPQQEWSNVFVEWMLHMSCFQEMQFYAHVLLLLSRWCREKIRALSVKNWGQPIFSPSNG